MPIPKPRSSRALLLAVPFAVAGLAILAFLPSLPYGFVSDDFANFVFNKSAQGLSAANIGWAFTTRHLGVYQPFAWLAIEAQYSLFGLNASAYRVVNLLLHGINCALLYWVVLQIARPEKRDEKSDLLFNLTAAFAVSIFSLHPLRTEAVVWISTQPYLFCALFLLLSTNFYLRYVGSQGTDRRAFALSLGFFGAALLSKAVAIMFPIVPLLVDSYPLRRLSRRWGKVWKEKLAFLSLTLPFVALALWARAGHPEKPYEIPGRLIQSSYGLLFPLLKTIFPRGLTGFYPLPSEIALYTSPRFCLSPLLVLLGVALLFLARRRLPALVVALAAYAALLLPNLGMVGFSNTFTADRYSYVACLVFPPLIARGLYSLLLKYGKARSGPVLAGIALLLLVPLGGLTLRQLPFWQDSVTYWTRAYNEGGQGSNLVNYFLGLSLVGKRKLDEATPYLKRSILLFDDPVEQAAKLNEIANNILQTGNARESLHWLAWAAMLNPQDPMVHNSLGTSLMALHDVDAAEAEVRGSLQLDPSNEVARSNLEYIESLKKTLAQQIPIYTEDVALHPKDPERLNRLAILHAMRGDLVKAKSLLDEALALEPSLEETRRNLAKVEEALGGPALPFYIESRIAGARNLASTSRADRK